MARVVIFANGAMPYPQITRSRLRPADYIICADGGTHHALALGLQPQAVIGDLDSLSPEVVTELESQDVTIHRYPVRKDETDLELAFRLALREKPDEILLLSALGGRLDQTLANILLLTRPEYAPIRLTLTDGPQVATLLRPGESLVVAGQPGDLLSLVPLTRTVAGVSLTGVEWPLHQAVLSLGSTWSISNVLAAREAVAAIGEGLVLVIHLETQYKEFYE